MALGQPAPDAPGQERILLRRGRVLEGITLGWNVAGIVASLGIVAATFPLLRRITGPEVARND